MTHRSPAQAGAQCLRFPRTAFKTPGSCLRRRAFYLLAPILLTACANPDLPAGPAPIDPIAFFTGPTSGTGILDPIVGKSARVTVRSEGVLRGDTLTLTQRIKEGDKKERTRLWTIRKLPNGYLSTLTDAQGMVTVETSGPRSRIGYTTPGGIRIHQQLALQADGRTILNRLTAYKFGIRVAVLEETIRKPLAK